MRRWYLTAAIVAGLGLGPAHADYIVIRMNIGGKSGAEPAGAGRGVPGMPPGGAPAGEGGGGFKGGAGGRPGGGGGGLPGGGGGDPAGLNTGGGAGRPGGAGGQGQPGRPAMPGMPGGMPGAMGPGMPGAMGPGRPGGMGPGMPGGMPGGMGPGMPGGMPGAMGPGMPGAMGPGMPGAMGPGMPGMGGGMGSAAGSDFDTFETVVMAVVELTDSRRHLNEAIQGLPGQYKTKWGLTALYNDGEFVQSWHVPVQTPISLYHKHRRELENARVKKASDYLDRALWALNYGLVKECEALIAEAVNIPDPSPAAQAQLAAFAKIKPALDKPFEGTQSVNAWREKLNGFQAATSEGGHYAIFYAGSGQAVPEEVKHLGALLENHMRSFYLWFALKGKALPLPAEKLVVIQVDSADTFKTQRAVLDLQGLSEGFYAPRDNVAVFSTRRLDESYVTFSKQMQTYWSEGWNRDELLRGRQISQLKEGIKKSGGRREFLTRDFPRMQTLALLEKALEDEAELAAVSHEGTRQLAVATGLVSRNVVIPEWVSFGFASLFETPKGPFAGSDGTAQVAFWSGVGAPSWAYVRQFKKWAASKDEFTKLDPAPDALRRTVTDAYFNRTRLPQNLEIDPKLSKSESEKREKEIARAKEEAFRAKAHAWALNYYLVNDRNRFDSYLAFLNDLGNLPRDLELDDQTLILAFARAFKLTNAAGDAVDAARFTEFANDWIDKMSKVDSPGREFKLDEPKRELRGGVAGRPGIPGGGPAGGPGPAGGGGVNP